MGGEPQRPHVDFQAPPGRQVPRRPGLHLRRRQVHLRPPAGEVGGRQGGLHRRRQGRAVGEVRDQVPDEGAVRLPGPRPRRLLRLHHQRGRRLEGRRRPQQDDHGHGALHAGRLEGRAADGLQEEPGLLQERAAARRRGRRPDHPRRGEHGGRPEDRADPPRLHRGQQELDPPEGREDADRLSVVAPRIRLPEHQCEPRSAEGRARPPGHQLGSRPRRGTPGRRRWLRASHRPVHGADEGVGSFPRSSG